ncbi:MAG: hybrid sensor histidine kinase/response regulator [Synechococcus sp.]|nr:hybrid sensor histidine kinase/response regulator [Synechococcus sp.]
MVTSGDRDRVLVVDDSPDNLLLIQSILEDENLDIFTVSSGSKALDLVRQQPFHLILLDIMMPQMDGFEITRQIRNDPHLPYIPILLITAHAQPSVALGLDIGADDFIRKPVEIDELIARVRSLLRFKHTVDEKNMIVRQREDFASRLTHDMRTPLIAADRMLNLLLQGALGELSVSIQEVLRTMSRSNANLLEMVNNILEVYRYESERKTFYFSRIDLSAIMGNVLEELQPLAQEKGIQLQGKIPPESVWLEGDRLAIHRVLVNLVSNGIKFTDQGQVTLILEKIADIAVQIQVSDTGCGIDPEDHQEIFERFRQGKHYQGGSGLGLHLSKLIIEAHQGTISLNSRPQAGSTFTIVIPLSQMPSQSEEKKVV